MKKIISALLVICSVFAFAFSAVGCKKNGGEAPPEPTYVVFDGFEDFEKDFLTIRMVNNFGKININYDEKYVKFGKASAKLEPSGGTFETTTPTILLPTYSTRYDYDYSDFSKTESVSAWFYNAEERDLTVGIGLQKGVWTNGQWWDKVDRTNAVYYTLKNGWNYIEFSIEPEYLACQTGFDIKSVDGVFFEFEYTSQFGDVPVIYMDDLRLHFSENEVKGSEISLKSDAENGVWEIADFEDARQNLFMSLPAANAAYQRMNSRVVNASKYQVEAKSGNNVLEIVAHPSMTAGGWPGVILSSVAVHKAVKSIGQDIADNPNAYEFKFDYYNACSASHSYGISYSSAALSSAANPWINMTTLPFTWNTYSINVSKINETLLGASAKLKEGYTESDLDFVKTPSGVEIYGTGYAADTFDGDKIYLIDNIRIEKIKTGGTV